MVQVSSPLADTRSTQEPKHAMIVRVAIHNHDDNVSTSISTAWA
ncbi:senescence-associated protein [Senna tora]|uniref:Senescence-associated protein n=1 Tax=Senna tora TaxID=362788 RepID=A0A834WHQ8_9FABA|nr:senescence-associated protein [Senna tora]